MSDGIGASINALQAGIAANTQATSLPAINANGMSGLASGDGASGVGSAFKQVIEGVNEQDRIASEKMAAVDSGRSDDLVGAMLSSQEASLSFSMLMHARNKI